MSEPNPRHIGDHAASDPDRPAVILADGTAGVSHHDIDRRSHAPAGRLAAAGMGPGDHVAILMDNRSDVLVAAWAAHRSGLHDTPVTRHLTAGEVGHILADRAARAMLSAAERRDAVPAGRADPMKRDLRARYRAREGQAA